MPVDPRPHRTPRPLRRRLVWSIGLAAGAVIGATLMVPSYGNPFGDRDGSLADRYRSAVKAERQRQAEARPHQHPAGLAGALDGHGHSHNDPRTKNSISRTGATGPDTADPTTAAERAAGVAAVRAQRAEPDPELRPVAARPHRRAVPEDRFAMASGCYALASTSRDAWVTETDEPSTGFATTTGRRRNGEPFHFQATDLGRYLLFTGDKRFLAQQHGLLGAGTTVRGDDAASRSADWRVHHRGSGQHAGYTFTNVATGDGLRVAGDGALTTGGHPSTFRLHTTKGCAHWPEIGTSMRGRTFRGVSSTQEVRGYLDAHTHGMAFEFLGGKVHCGRPWHPYGVTEALKDCADHTATNGYGAALEAALSGNPHHDPVGWPTFKDWPAPNSLTHEGTYYKWMERAWRGGLRIFTNLLVENNKLCELYPLKKNSCDDMDSIRLQAKRMRQLERYVDAQYGGPGEGWYRIVTSPFQARRVINEGKLAVIMGIETSIPFHCTMKADLPQCDESSIDEQLAEMHRLGVRQMELVNKFDNALAGVAGDEGETGVLVNTANFLETGSFWAMEHCENQPAGVHDKEQYAAPTIDAQQQDAIFGAVAELSGVQPAPLYGPAPHCNRRGLTDLGSHLIRELADRGMVFDPDHMSVSARKSSLDLLERLDYPGVVSSHSWATPDAYPRIYRLGGTITPYAGDSEGFVTKWRKHLQWADPRYYFGFGYGADMNGLGAQGDPRGADVPNPVTYPFRALGGVQVRKQHSGKRVYDINVDGVSHYGLYPDWIEDLSKVAGADSTADGRAISADMERGPEAYLQMWERAVGVSNDACRDPEAMKRASRIRDLPAGASAARVLRLAGQPHRRLGDTFTYCGRDGSGGTTHVTVRFDGHGRVVRAS